MIIKSPPKLTNRKTFIKYLEVDIWSWLRELANGLLRLNFQDNFQTFTAENILIPAGTEVAIPNQFSQSLKGTIPRGRLIIRQSGDATIIDGDSPWNADTVFLKNPSANDATVTVLFFI